MTGAPTNLVLVKGAHECVGGFPEGTSTEFRNELQCIAVCCSVLQRNTCFRVKGAHECAGGLPDGVLQCVAMCYIVLQYGAVCCSALGTSRTV